MTTEEDQDCQMDPVLAAFLGALVTLVITLIVMAVYTAGKMEGKNSFIRSLQPEVVEEMNRHLPYGHREYYVEERK